MVAVAAGGVHAASRRLVAAGAAVAPRNVGARRQVAVVATPALAAVAAPRSRRVGAEGKNLQRDSNGPSVEQVARQEGTIKPYLTPPSLTLE